MSRFFTNYRLPENIEVLFMLLLGMILQSTDGSPFDVPKKWKMVWETVLPVEFFSPFTEKCIKAVLTMIVTVRCLTTYLYVISGIIVIYCIITDSHRKLMLIWLLIACIKSICMTFLEALTGVYVCSAFGKIRKACVEFFVSKALEIIFAAYLWGSVQNIYQDMERKAEVRKTPDVWEQLFMQKLDFNRHRVRSLVDESILYKTACINYFEYKDVPRIIIQMLRRDKDTSDDSILNPGMMLASVSNLGSFDHLKTSLSLGELGLIDLKNVQVVGLEDEYLSPPEKALKFLNLTWSDVETARDNKNRINNDFYSVDEDTWKHVTNSNAIINKQRHRRAEIFMRDIPLAVLNKSTEFANENAPGKSSEINLDFSLCNCCHKKDGKYHNHRNEDQLSVIFKEGRRKKKKEDKYDEEEENDGDDDDDDDNYDDKVGTDKMGTTSLFMSNLKDGADNRHCINALTKALKGNTYADLYKQDYMNVIGPEVYDKATKLPKLSSPSTLIQNMETGASASLPILPQKQKRLSEKLTNLEEDPSEKSEIISKIDLETSDLTHTKEQSQESITAREDAISQTSTTTSRKEDDTLSAEEQGIEHKNKESKKLSYSSIDSGSHHVGKIKGTNIKGENENAIESVSSSDTNDSKIIATEQNTPQRTLKEKVISKIQLRLYTRSRNKRIQIKRIRNIALKQKNSQSNGLSKGSDDSSSYNINKRSKTKLQRDKTGSTHKTNTDCSNSASNSSRPDNIVISRTEKKKQIYFLMCPIYQPISTIIMNSYNLKNQGPKKVVLFSQPRSVKENKSNNINNANQQVNSYKNNTERMEYIIGKKVWKSKVLETALYFYFSETQNDFYKLNQETILEINYKLCALQKILSSKKLSSSVSLKGNKRNETEPNFSDAKDQEDSKALALLTNRDFEWFSDPGNVDRPPIKVSQNESSRECNFSVGNSESLNSNNQLYLSLKNNDSCMTSENVISENGSLIEEFYDASDSRLVKSNMNFGYSNATASNHKNYESNSSKFEIQRKSNESQKTGQCELNESVASKENSINTAELLWNFVQEDPSSNQESDEPFSLYYSKAADLASPLLDTKRFIYPDRIHYSYKHVKKKGFDVNINGGLPLLVHESLTTNSQMKSLSNMSESEAGITVRPMDLSFASTEAFAEWPNKSQNDSGSFIASSGGNILPENKPGVCKSENKGKDLDQSATSKRKKTKKTSRSKKNLNSNENYCSSQNECGKKSKCHCENCINAKKLSIDEKHFVVEKLLKMHKNQHYADYSKIFNYWKERMPIQISSTQLHTNKGRIKPTYNPAIFLHENRTRKEKKKTESQEERTKDMFVRLEKEILMQNKNCNNTFNRPRNT